MIHFFTYNVPILPIMNLIYVNSFKDPCYLWTKYILWAYIARNLIETRVSWIKVTGIYKIRISYTESA